MHDNIYEVVELKDLDTDLIKTEPLYFDVETGGENYGTMVLAQLYQEHWTKVKVIEFKNHPSYAMEFLLSIIEDCEIIGHNLMYEMKQFDKHTLDYKPFKLWGDTFYASRLVFPSWMEYSLDACLTKLLGYDPYQQAGLDKKVMQKSFDPTMDCTHDQLVYGAIDVYELPKLWNKVKQISGDFNYELDRKIATYSLDVSKKGMPVDFDELDKLMLHFQSEVARTEAILGNNDKGVKLNVNSYVQVRKLLGLENSSDELTLKILANRPDGLEGHEWWNPKIKVREIQEPNYKHTENKCILAMAIVEQRKALKRLNFRERAYANGSIDDEGVHRISSEFSPHQITGRVSSSDENLSQYPRDIKRMWGHKPNAGKVLIYADYSQLELRSICAMLGEGAMQEAYDSDLDIHQFTADSLEFEESLLPDGVKKRFVAKQLNFLTLYGGSNSMFQGAVCKTANVWLDMEGVIKPAIKAWKNRYPVIKDWQVRNNKSKTKMDKTMCGRWYKAKTPQELCNYSNQGSGAEIAKLAWHNGYKYNVFGYSTGVDFLGFFHDAYILECDDDPKVYIPAAKKLATLMSDAWFQVTRMAKFHNTQMPVTVQVGYNWKDMEDETEDVLYTYNLKGMAMYEKDIQLELEKINA